MKKLTAILLALLMLVSCVPGLAEIGEVVKFPLAEPMEFDVVVRQGAQDLSTDYSSKLCYQQLSEKTNVVINWMAFRGGSYGEKVVQMIGGNDLPDVFTGGMLDVMNNYEVYVDLLPYMEAGHMPNWYAYLKAHPEEMDYLMLDGGIYCLPVSAGAEPRLSINGLNGGIFYINNTFCANFLDGKVPTTIDELYEALKIARDNDINGNGEKDEIPILCCNGYKPLDVLGQFWGMGRRGGNYVQYTEDGKTVEFVANTEAYKSWLQTMSKWYAEGLINSDVYSLPYDEFSTRFVNDSSMIAFCLNFTPDMSFSDGLSNWTPILYLDNPGYENVYVNNANYECLEGMAITKACKNPEVIMAFIDAINDDFETWAQWRYGNKGEIWDYADDGYHYYTYLMGKALDSGLGYGKYRQTYGAHCFGLSFGGIYEDRKVEDPATEVPGAARAYIYKLIDDMIRPETVVQGVNRYGYWDEEKTEELDELELALNTYCDQFKANAIVHGFTDADWDKYCQELNDKLDVETYMTLFNEYMTRND